MSFLIHTRQFSTTVNLLARHLTKRSNPGIGHQIKAIEDAVEIIQSDPEAFREFESDFMDVHKSHKQHEIELQKQNEKIRRYIVERKYFHKNPLPNLLTYAEKEQIKYLHSNDNEEWTVEKLAESFPASTETIRKVLKANWKPMSSKRILYHDASVLQNWERFKKGEFETQISGELQKHLQKFVDRTPEDLYILQNRLKAFPKKQWQKPKSKEFLSIVTLQSAENSNEQIPELTDGEKPQNVNNQQADDTYLLGKIQNKKPITLKEFKHKLDQSLPDLKSNAVDKEVTQNSNNINDTAVIKKNDDSQNSAIFDYKEKFSTNEVVITEEDRKKYEMTAIKERIYIPKKLRRKGAIYRVSDCYYDDDGEFLYKVPGMVLQ